MSDGPAETSAEKTVPDPITFDEHDIVLLRKATWMAAVKYDELRIQAQQGRGRGSMGNRSNYWDDKHKEMLAVYEKLGSGAVISLVSPPF